MKASRPIGHVTFVGAGPGDPELLTVKGQKALAAADVVIYAGSLVPLSVAEIAGPEAELRDSASLTLPQIHALMRDHALAGRQVVRLHTGDPSLYGALHEQTRLLDRDGIPWSIIPGVTAAMAAAAAGGISFTIPESTQTLILTRGGGRTPMPESLAHLAAHGASMAIYLAGEHVKELVAQLGRHLVPQTPVICAHRLGWPDEHVCHTTLGHLSQCVTENRMQRQTVILVLPGHLREGKNSRLYDPDFSHGYRQMDENGRFGK